MKLSEAYQELGIKEGASEDEAKKAFRNLSKTYHPDNKDSGNEAKFKKINQAYQCVQNGKGDDREDNFASNPWAGGNPFSGSGFNPFEHFATHFNNSNKQSKEAEDIQVDINLTFKESILGKTSNISFKREECCKDCKGQGNYKISNNCKKCSGKGVISSQKGNMIFQQTCSDCKGRVNKKDCTNCKTEGFIISDVNLTVSVPPGIFDGNILRLSGVGNYTGTFMGVQDQYTDVFCYLKVEKEEGLTLEGKNVISHLNISLLEALQGCSKSVKTIDGDQTIEVKELSKHNQKINIPKLGVNRENDQVVVLSIDYPENVEKLIKALKNEIS